jgi:hypothetical protein
VEVSLGPSERAALAAAASVVASVGTDEDDPARRRLSPPAYADDATADREFRRLMAEELGAVRRFDLSVFGSTLASGRRKLQTDEAESWLRVIGDARLVLAARRGMQVDDDRESRPVDVPGLEILAWLGWIQQELVESLTPGLRDP